MQTILFYHTRIHLVITITSCRRSLRKIMEIIFMLLCLLRNMQISTIWNLNLLVHHLEKEEVFVSISNEKIIYKISVFALYFLFQRSIVKVMISLCINFNNFFKYLPFMIYFSLEKQLLCLNRIRNEEEQWVAVIPWENYTFNVC